MTDQTDVEAKSAGRTALLWVAVLLVGVIAAGIGYSRYVMQGRSNQVAQSVQSTISAVRNGDLQAALVTAQMVASSSLSTADQKALVKISTAAIPYRISADPSLLVSHIAVLKSVIEDPSVSLPIHVAAINQLASAYCGSGRTWAVFQEIYKGSPYSSFLVPNDPDTSGRNMFEWSYSQYPTADAGMDLARSYAGVARLQIRDHEATSSIDATIAKAQSYLASADQLEKKESSEQAFNYDRSQRYAIYLYWHAYTDAMLAMFARESYIKDGSYEQKYQQEYEDFISKYQNDGYLQYSYAPYARLLYAYFLHKDTQQVTPATSEKIASLYAALIAEVKSDPYYNTDEFVRFVKNEKELRAKGIWQGVFSSAILTAESASPEFASFAAGIT